MNRDRAIELLTAYRQGEGLEFDPEVKEALEWAERDAELAALRRETEHFDDVFGTALRSTEVPATLQEDILMALRQRVKEPRSTHRQTRLFQWFHPALFASAAAIIILLALSFTFWDRPHPLQVQPLMVDNSLMATADVLYADMKPSFVSRNDGEQVLNYLRNHGGIVPTGMPRSFAWDLSFACDILEVDGKKVSLICFRSPDKNNTMHLFTFLRSDFPDLDLPAQPQVGRSKAGTCATWANEEAIHVLYSEKGEEKLRQFLEI
jgi:hypothetical protein